MNNSYDSSPNTLLEDRDSSGMVTQGKSSVEILGPLSSASSFQKHMICLKGKSWIVVPAGSKTAGPRERRLELEKGLMVFGNRNFLWIDHRAARDSGANLWECTYFFGKPLLFLGLREKQMIVPLEMEKVRALALISEDTGLVFVFFLIKLDNLFYFL